MSYIVVAEFSLDSELNMKSAVDELLKEPDIRLLRIDGDDVSLDVRGDYMKTAEIVKRLCNRLIDKGIVEFSIHHSY